MFFFYFMAYFMEILTNDSLAMSTKSRCAGFVQDISFSFDNWSSTAIQNRTAMFKETLNQIPGSDPEYR